MLSVFAHLWQTSFAQEDEDHIREDDIVNVHFVPHSHMDAGWLKTYDQYYELQVCDIFQQVFAKLRSDPKYTYTLGDIAYFKRYYEDKPAAFRRETKALVANGQLDLVHGGMVSTDEASPDYADILRNFEQAHDFLWKEFGVKPKIGWQLDPFGHSGANAEIFAELGFEAMVFARINEQDFAERKLT